MSNGDPVGDAYKEFVKSYLTLPAEGAKTMGVGCVQIAAVYGAVVGLITHDSSLASQGLEPVLMFLPLALWAIAGFLYGCAFMPIRKYLPFEVPSKAPGVGPMEMMLDRYKTTRALIIAGTVVFVLAVILALNTAYELFK